MHFQIRNTTVGDSVTMKWIYTEIYGFTSEKNYFLKVDCTYVKWKTFTQEFIIML